MAALRALIFEIHRIEKAIEEHKDLPADAPMIRKHGAWENVKSKVLATVEIIEPFGETIDLKDGRKFEIVQIGRRSRRMLTVDGKKVFATGGNIKQIVQAQRDLSKKRLQVLGKHPVESD